METCNLESNAWKSHAIGSSVHRVTGSSENQPCLQTLAVRVPASPDCSVQRVKPMKGEQVVLHNGQHVIVQYVSPTMNIVRVRTLAGKTRTVRVGEIRTKICN